MINTNVGTWMLLQENYTDEQAREEFVKVFSREPEHVEHEPPWKLVGPVTKEEQDKRKSR